MLPLSIGPLVTTYNGACGLLKIFYFDQCDDRHQATRQTKVAASGWGDVRWPGKAKGHQTSLPDDGDDKNSNPCAGEGNVAGERNAMSSPLPWLSRQSYLYTENAQTHTKNVFEIPQGVVMCGFCEVYRMIRKYRPESATV